MTSSRGRTCTGILGALAAALLALAAAPSAARAREPETPELDAERDKLIDKLTRGVDFDASVKRFAELVKQRDAVVATSAAAQERDRARSDQIRKFRDEYTKTGDHNVAWRCTLSPDPAHPIPSTEGRFKGDWGKIVRKQALRLTPKNDLDEGEPVTLYEIDGRAERYFVRGEQAAYERDRPFNAEVGDLVMVCKSGSDHERRMPPGFDQKLTHAFLVRIAAPPAIAHKARWNPIHVTESAVFWIIHDVKWKFPPDAYLLYNFPLGDEIAPGQWKIESSNGLFWILEIPPALRRKELLQTGRYLWVILGHHRFDKQLKTLVMQAEDIEEHYVVEK
jgi:hypothetical protein